MHKRQYGLDTDWALAKTLLKDCKGYQALIRHLTCGEAVDAIDRNGPDWVGEYASFARYIEDISQPNNSEPPPSDDGKKGQTPPSSLPHNHRASRNSKPRYNIDLSDANDYCESPSMAKKPKIDTPRTETNNLAAKDEQTVTAMFIALVRELSALATQTPHTWTIERINFRATFKLKQHMTAEVDGAFWDRDTRLTKSIFEAKRKQRADIFDTVRMQEGAELAAWYAVADYNSLPGLNGR